MKEKGDCGRAAFPLVALYSLLRGGRGHSGAISYAARIFLVKGKDEATRVCLEREMFYCRFKMLDPRAVWLLGFEGPVHISDIDQVSTPFCR